MFLVNHSSVHKKILTYGWLELQPMILSVIKSEKELHRSQIMSLWLFNGAKSAELLQYL